MLIVIGIIYTTLSSNKPTTPEKEILMTLISQTTLIMLFFLE